MSAAPRSFVDVGANRLRLLHDGAGAYPAMLDAISEARREDLAVDDQDLAVIAERDAGGSKTPPEGRHRAELAHLAARVEEGRPPRGVEPEAAHGVVHRTHADPRASARRERVPEPRAHGVAAEPVHLEEHGFVGGINLAEPWQPPGAPERAWRDDAVEVRGPAAGDLRDAVHRQWLKLGGLDEAAPSAERRRAAGARVCVVVNRIGRRPDRVVRRMYLLAVRRARRSIEITAAYFLPGPRLLHALRGAARRGVRVRLLVPRRSDVPIVDLATSSIIGRLLESGVRVFAYDARTLHAKTAVVDGALATVGSHNLDSLSWRLNLECNLAIADAAFARLVEASFERDLAHATEIDLASWKRRPLRVRVAGWVAALFRSVL